MLKKIIWRLAIVLGIFATVIFAQWKWHIFPVKKNLPTLHQDEAKNEQIKTADAPKMTQNNVRDVLAAKLFGAEQVAKSAATEQVVVKTQLPLELRGILAIKNAPEKSNVLIAQTGQMAQVYGLGDELPDQAGRIHAILENAVQIERENRLELLELPEPAETQMSAATNTGMPTVPAPEDSETMDTEQPVEDVETVESTEETVAPPAEEY